MKPAVFENRKAMEEMSEVFLAAYLKEARGERNEVTAVVENYLACGHDVRQRREQGGGDFYCRKCRANERAIEKVHAARARLEQMEAAARKSGAIV